MICTITPSVGTAVHGAWRLELHDSLANRLLGFARPDQPGTLTETEAARLDAWAEDCDNPTGQRAALTRGLAGLIRSAGRVTVSWDSGPPPGTFWDAVRQGA